MSDKFSYSFHISNGKNAIKNKSNLTKCIRHNVRSYKDGDASKIKILIGADNAEDVNKAFKETYFKLFNPAVEEYNKNQKRKDRRITNYFDHVSNDSKTDIATEIIIQVGDKKNQPKGDLTDFYSKQIERLKKECPNFEIVHAALHFDETTPHLHILGIPYSNYGKGLSRRVSKTKVFTKTKLEELQNNMRKGYKDINQDIKKGRNHDFTVAEYSRMQKEIEEKLEKKANILLEMDKKQINIENEIEKLLEEQKVLRNKNINLHKKMKDVELLCEAAKRDIETRYNDTVNVFNDVIDDFINDFDYKYTNDFILKRIFGSEDRVNRFKAEYERIETQMEEALLKRPKELKKQRDDSNLQMDKMRKEIEKHSMQNSDDFSYY